MDAIRQKLKPDEQNVTDRMNKCLRVTRDTSFQYSQAERNQGEDNYYL